MRKLFKEESIQRGMGQTLGKVQPKKQRRGNNRDESRPKRMTEDNEGVRGWSRVPNAEKKQLF